MENIKNKLTFPYLKEKSILQLPIFYFGMTNVKEMVTQWEDEKGKYTIKCFCDYGVPGGLEQDIYAGCMRLWVLQGMPDTGIEVSYSDIARILRLTPPKNWVSKIKKALLRLGLARYEFHHCFLSANSDESTIKQFSLFDTTSFFDQKNKKSKKRKSRSKIYFPTEIKVNLEEKYYQWLDMIWFRSLPNGLPRRLYEYLEKRRYHNVNGKFVISEEALCRWLPVKDKNTTTRRRTLKKIAQSLIDAGYLSFYNFCTQKKQCVFIYTKNPVPKEQTLADSEKKLIELGGVAAKETASEISPPQEQREDITHLQRTTDKQQLVFVEALDWINSILYFHTKRRTEIASLPLIEVARLYPEIRREYEQLCKIGEKPGPGWVYNAFMQRKVPQSALDHFNQDEALQPETKIGTKGVLDLFSLIKIERHTKKLQRAVEKYYQSHGCEYVKWNILYANKHAKKSYSTYLQKALAENWAEEWAQEERERIELEQKRIEEERRKAEEERQKELERQQAEKEKPLFLEKIAQMDNSVKCELWELAEKNVAPEAIRRENLVKIHYLNFLWQHLAEEGESFSKAILDDLPLVFKLERPETGS